MRFIRKAAPLMVCAGLPLIVGAAEARKEGPISRSFEMRYFSSNPQANGETDFKGPTAVFSTADRVEYLRQYSRYARGFFKDPRWDTRVATDADADAVLAKIKPQPLPSVRRRIRLEQWKYMGSRPGQSQDDERRIASWRGAPGVAVANGELRFTRKAAGFTKAMPQQHWRMALEWRAKPPDTARRVRFSLLGAAEVGFGEDGRFYWTTAGGEATGGTYQPGSWTEFKVELDFESGRYNFYAGSELLADFVPLPSKGPFTGLKVEGVEGLAMDDIWGVGYVKNVIVDEKTSRDIPYSIATFIDENFEVRPPLAGWQNAAYDDSAWKPAVLPHAHGGERHAGEDLYLRAKFKVGAVERAALVLEAIDPAGEIWINGEVAAAIHDRYPSTIDVSRFLLPDRENVIAVRVRPNYARILMRHTAADRHTGWFAGRMWLDLTGKLYLDDVFITTKSVGDPAVARVEVGVRNRQWTWMEGGSEDKQIFDGKLTVEAYPWFPEESREAAAAVTFPVSLRYGEPLQVVRDIPIPSPRLWSPEQPQLYRFVVRLEDVKGKALDDAVVTTGLRTVSQEGGTFRINGKPAMMNGALLFGYRAPLDKIAQWQRCSPAREILKDLLMLKRMNANTARMSHHDGPEGGINDPRYAEFGDQLGILFQWSTSAWVRTASPWQISFDGLSRCVRQVRNHPSIVMWQPGNHPWFLSFEEGMTWFRRAYNAIYPHDPSRLLSLSASSARLHVPSDDGTLDEKGRKVEPIPVWTAPGLTRGNMDHATGYGAEWNSLRLYPDPPAYSGADGWRGAFNRVDHMASKVRAYFDFESEESAAQSNWNLHRGKPQYQQKSYEFYYDKGSIGRELSVEEWEESQAWQAFSGYEAYRKKRWLDFDGLAWCNLRGGPNTATYQKPLIDYYGHAKMAFHAVRMAFQPVLAGSKNVDLVYGPSDAVPVVVMNLGEARTVNVTVTMETVEGMTVESKTYTRVFLPAGRAAVDLAPFRPKRPANGHYVVRYEVTPATGTGGPE